MPDELQNAIEAPEETIVEVSATSHLKNLRLPDSESESGEESAALPEVKLPKTLKAVHEALEAAGKETDARIRRHKVGVLTKRLHELSQMPEPPELDVKKLNAAQNRSAEEIHIEMLGRQFPVVKKWISELTAKNEALEKELSALKKK